MAKLVFDKTVTNKYEDISFEDWNENLKDVSKPFMDFINKYPNVFSLDNSSDTYVFHIQLTYLNIKWE